MANLITALRGKSTVDCDTLDADFVERTGPYVDCTSNQAIAFIELSKTEEDGSLKHEKLIKESIRDAHWMLAQAPGCTVEDLAVELMMVNLAVDIIPNITGRVHIQVNPKLSYDTGRMINNGHRIHAIFRHILPDFPPSRICIKVPATWEGLQACRILENRGIATLATTMFCMEQAALAAHVGCVYIAPYVNELKVHFDPGYIDQNKAFAFCGQAQRYFRSLGQGCETQVLAASLTSVEECMELAGVEHITISPPLLSGLLTTQAEGFDAQTIGKMMNDTASYVPPKYDGILKEEGIWKMAFTRSQGGQSEAKIIQAINIFANMQDDLEALAKKMAVVV